MTRTNKLALCLLTGVALTSVARAQNAPPNGPRNVDPRWHALVHATLIPRPGARIDDATVVVRGGRIVTVEAGGAPPKGARVWDCTGLTVHAGLIDPHVAIDADAPKDASGAHWNTKVMAQRDALQAKGLDAETTKTLRSMGFTAAAIAPKDGIFRGTAAVVLLDEKADTDGVAPVSVVAHRVYHSVALDRSGSGYPGSLMGIIALVRQTLSDAEWHAQCRAAYGTDPTRHEPPRANHALAALGSAATSQLPLLVHVSGSVEQLRANSIGREFQRKVILLGNGREYERLDELRQDGSPVILSLAFPEAPKIQSVAAMENTSLRDLVRWEQAPTNPRRVHAAGVHAMLSTDGLEKAQEFLANLKRALTAGLQREAALAMLTTNTAATLGISASVGSVEVGKLANLVSTLR